MRQLPLFDSLQHPLPKPQWIDARFSHRLELDQFLHERADAGITHSFAVGMGPNWGGYDEETYSRWVFENVPGGLPVAWCDPSLFHGPLLVERLQRLKQLGYAGIKLHPRLGQFCFDDIRLRRLLPAATDAGLIVLLCTYPFGRNLDPRRMTIDCLAELLFSTGAEGVVLLHGGLTRLVELADVVRECRAVLLDLSFTMLRYAGSSVDSDLRYVCQRFDQKVCVGSDHPQYSLSEFREKFEWLVAGLTEDRKLNVASDNLHRLLGDRHR
jgi:predicted TIM-barrel fold metal-dependent hydrolase